MFASTYGHTQAVEMLLGMNADPLKSAKGVSAVDLARNDCRALLQSVIQMQVQSQGSSRTNQATGSSQGPFRTTQTAVDLARNNLRPVLLKGVSQGSLPGPAVG